MVGRFGRLTLDEAVLRVGGLLGEGLVLYGGVEPGQSGGQREEENGRRTNEKVVRLHHVVDNARLGNLLGSELRLNTGERRKEETSIFEFCRKPSKTTYRRVEVPTIVVAEVIVRRDEAGLQYQK